MNPEVVILMCTYNRHVLLERAVGSFLQQDYDGKHTLVIYNTGEELVLDKSYENIILINNKLDYLTYEPYISVGAKHRDALTHCPRFDIIVHLCDDDYVLPNYIYEGVKGLLKFMELGYSAYKPRYSFYKHKIDEAILAENVMEPSIFMLANDLLSTGYICNSVTYHDGWLKPLIEKGKIYTDEEGVATFVYDWSGEFPAFKLSGRGIDDEQNFKDSQAFADTDDDNIIHPWTYSQLEPYYKLCKI